jgi:hypothetical protein
MGTPNEKRMAPQGAQLLEGGRNEQESFFQRRSVLVSVFLVGLVLVVAVPTIILSVGFTDDCNSGNTLIDNACMSAKRRQGEDHAKKAKINIRPKKEPFKIVDKPGIGLGGLSQTPP